MAANRVTSNPVRRAGSLSRVLARMCVAFIFGSFQGACHHHFSFISAFFAFAHLLELLLRHVWTLPPARKMVYGRPTISAVGALFSEETTAAVIPCLDNRERL
jgi:hypothetical protein